MDHYIVVGRSERCSVGAKGEVVDRWHSVDLLHSASQRRVEHVVPKEKFLEHKLGAKIAIELRAVPA